MQRNERQSTADRPVAEGGVRYRPNRLGHVNLFVKDYAETCRFLKDVCGFAATGLIPDIGSGFFSNGRTHHDVGFIELAGYQRFKEKRTYEIVEPENRGEAPGLNHFGWEMRTEKDLVDAYERALAAGVTPRVTNNGTSYSNYLFDPGGGQHQLYADNELDWRVAYTGGVVDLHRPANWHPGRFPPSEQEMFQRTPAIRRDDKAPLSPMGVTHAMILTGDMDSALEFYCGMIGLTGAVYGTDRRFAWLSAGEGPPAIILVETPTITADQIHHAAFELWPGDDLAAASARLAAIGVPTVARVTTAYKDSLFITNPDGIHFEFYRSLRPIDAGAAEGFVSHGLFGL